MAEWRLVFRVHAVQRMFERGTSEADVRHVVERGETIEEYPADRPYPSRLVLGSFEGRSLHVVVAENTEQRERIVITVYEPDPATWDASFRRRRTR